MKVDDFNFDLPKELIAKYPLENRSSSRLLSLNGNTGELKDCIFSDILEFIDKDDLLIFNNTKVIQARMYGRKETGGAIEVLVERILTDNTLLCHMRSSKSPKEGSNIYLGIDKNQEIEFKVIGRQDALFIIENLSELALLDILDLVGHMPLPPYMDRGDELEDKTRYQTVYNKVPGAVAAPTAGLHFDDNLLAKLKEKGINFAFVTLHVGAGTFQPIKVDAIENHHMHSEYFEVSKETVELIKKTKTLGKKVIAVGTTSIRSIESAAQKSKTLIDSFKGDTSIFIYPGFKFKVIDALITNFHLPKSTLIMLVSAFAKQDYIMNAYKHAVDHNYRFFSYGDAMFITKNSNS